MDTVSKDRISGLPEALIGHILSFLPTKEAVSTSLLSKTWRYLFALSPNLDFDDSVLYIRPEISQQKRDESHRMLMDSVDRVLRLQGNSTINKFSLDCLPGAYPPCVSRWIQNVMERGVSDLDLCVTVSWDDMMPGSVFVSKSLVRLRIKTWNLTDIDVDDVFLPNLKSLHLGSVKFRYSGKCPLFKLVSGCHVLEELVLIKVRWNDCWNLSLSSKTLKRLTLRCDERGSSPYLVSLDTPNLVFFDYAVSVSKMNQKVNFDSLVEASIDLRMTGTQFAHSFYYEDMVGNATDLLTRISNVQALYLTADTLEVLSFCGEQIPVFKNVIHLTIETRWDIGRESLPVLLKNCPNLETLVLEGLLHEKTTPNKEIELVKYFLEALPNLEQMILCNNTQIDEELIKFSSQLQMLPKLTSSKCKIQVIADNVVSLSSIVPEEMGSFSVLDCF